MELFKYAQFWAQRVSSAGDLRRAQEYIYFFQQKSQKILIPVICPHFEGENKNLIWGMPPLPSLIVLYNKNLKCSFWGN